MSSSKQVPYFFNSETKESTWEAPSGIAEEQIKQLPGAHLLVTDGKLPDKVRASHLLVKHSGSRRPSSWKEVCAFPSANHNIFVFMFY